MSILSTTPYLMLNGRANEAIGFYQEALGAKVVDLKRVGDAIPQCPPEQKNNVMHAELAFGGGKLMLSDGEGAGALLPPGVVSIAIRTDDKATTDRQFAALARGGKITQPFVEAPWGGFFGMVIDPYGVDWMFDCSGPG